jgi:hypothetical protein
MVSCKRTSLIWSCSRGLLGGPNSDPLMDNMVKYIRVNHISNQNLEWALRWAWTMCASARVLPLVFQGPHGSDRGSGNGSSLGGPPISRSFFMGPRRPLALSTPHSPHQSFNNPPSTLGTISDRRPLQWWREDVGSVPATTTMWRCRPLAEEASASIYRTPATWPSRPPPVPHCENCVYMEVDVAREYAWLG